MEKITNRILRKMGYKADSQGIIDRYINVSGAWEAHSRNTKNFILGSVAGKNIKNLAVFGSGWLLDLPLEELAASVEAIQLYDLVHPAQVIHRLKKYKNVSAIQADITGGAVSAAYESVRSHKKYNRITSPEQICNVLFQPPVVPDYIISLNILSQLGVLITDYLRLHVPYTSGQCELFDRLLQQTHLNLLEPGRSCLITDTNEINFDLQNSDEVENTALIRAQLPQANRMESWEWEFDHQGGYKPGKRTVFQVVAIEL